MTKKAATEIIIEWQGITLSVTHKPAYFGAGSDYEVDHIEVRSISPEKARLPITETGYRSYFLPGTDIEAFGDAVGYVRAWLDDTATLPAWKEHVANSKQLSLF